MREAITAGGRGFKAAVTPPPVEIEALDMCFVNDGAAVHGHVHITAPHAQYPRLPNHGHDAHSAFANVLDGG